MILEDYMHIVVFKGNSLSQGMSLAYHWAAVITVACVYVHEGGETSYCSNVCICCLA